MALINKAILSRCSSLATLSAIGLISFNILQHEALAQQREPAGAADDATGDIIVTAQRRSESLQKTPVAVGILGEGIIDQRNISQVRDLAGTVPGLFIPKTNSGGVQQIYIRGIGTSSPIYNGAVAIYVDDVYLPRIMNSSMFGSPDLERIEVLRGPQGTLYGQNTSAGAIKIISREPGNDFVAWVSGSAGSYNALEGKFYLSTPLIEDKLAISIAAMHQENSGFVKNLFLDRHVNGTRVSQIRAKVKFQPTEDIKFVLSGTLTKDTSDNAVGTPANYPGTRPRVTFDDRLYKQNYKQQAISLQSEFNLSDAIQLRSITAYRHFTNNPSTWSTDGIPGDVSGFRLNPVDSHFSQEVQLLGDYGNFNFVAGAIGFHEIYSLDRPAWTRSIYTGTKSRMVVKSLAFYAQGHLKLTDKLGVTAGARFNTQKDKFDWLRYDSNSSLEIVTVTSTVNDLTQKTSGIVPKLGIDYQFTPDLFGYASLTKGEKAGGFNAVAGNATVASFPLDPEVVTAYEVGAKVALFDRRVRLNFAGFYNIFNDYHATVQNPIIDGVQLAVPLITNAAKAITYGIEFDGTARIGSRLDLRLAATYLHAEFKRFDNPTGAPSQDFTGNVLPRSPKLTMNGGFTYTLPIDGAGEVRFGGDVEYSSKIFSDIPLTQPVQKYALVSTDLSYTSEDKHWVLSLRISNLLDKTIEITRQTIAAAGTTVYTYNAPRTALATLRYNF